jgi:hypothetical protein
LSVSDAAQDRADVARFGPIPYIRKPSKLDEFLGPAMIFKTALKPEL